MTYMWTLYKYETPKGWHYNEKFNVFQKVNDRVYVYVSNIFGGYMVQLYNRGAVSRNGFCVCEARTDKLNKEKLDYMFNLGEQWLNSYSKGNEEIINKDKFAISNPKGVWGNENIHEKLYWI